MRTQGYNTTNKKKRYRIKRLLKETGRRTNVTSPPTFLKNMTKPTYILIHHSAVLNSNVEQLGGINNYHKDKWNFKSSLGSYIGYNYLIEFNGKVNQTRANGETTAACYQKGMNDGRCIHICLTGNLDVNKPKDPQVFALRDLLKKLTKEFDISKDNIVFHKDYSSTVCPGKYMNLDFVRGLVGEAKPKKVKITTTKGQLTKIRNLLDELINKL